MTCEAPAFGVAESSWNTQMKSLVKVDSLNSYTECLLGGLIHSHQQNLNFNACMKKILKLVFLTIFSIPVFAEGGGGDGVEGTEQLFGIWGTVIVNGRFAKDSPWIWYADLSLRSAQQYAYSGNNDRNMVLAAVITHDAIGYQFNDNHSIHIGYAFQNVKDPYANQAYPFNENRAWEQYTYTTPTPFGNFSARSRFEQRTVNLSQSKYDGSEVGLRFRQQFRLSYPLDEQWSIIGWDEIFINANTVNWGPVSGIDQNRVFVGVSCKFDQVWRTEIGYMNQYINRDTANDRDFDLVSLNLYIDMPND